MARTPGLNDADLVAIHDLLAAEDAARTRAYPGDRVDRQPVHTVYVPADRFRIGARLNAYIHGAESGVMDEPATAQALAASLLRGIHCGAVSADEVRFLTGAEQRCHRSRPPPPPNRLRRVFAPPDRTSHPQWRV